MKILRADEIRKAYKDGIMDFSEIKATDISLADVDLSGSNFRNSNLSRTDFRGAKLIGVNFEKCNLSWCDFTRANLSNSNFSGADLRWSKFNDAILNGSNFSNADASYTLMINIIGNPDFGSCNTFKMATSWNQTQKEVWEKAETELEKAGFAHSSLIKIKSEISSFKQTLFNSLKLAYGKVKDLFSFSTKPSYLLQEEKFSTQTAYGERKNLYSPETAYKQKRAYEKRK